MATGSSSTQTLSLLRKLYRELRPTLPIGQKHVSDCSHWKYIMSLAKSSNSGDEQNNGRLYRLGQNYLGYLEHSRRHGELIAKYQGKGERTPEALAEQLGFRMPWSEPSSPNTNSNSNTQQNASSYSQ